MNMAISEEQEIVRQAVDGETHSMAGPAETESEKYIREHFPDIDPGMRPCGARVLVQLRKTKKVSDSGIQLISQTTEFNDEQGVIGRIVALGELAYRNRDTKELWHEGVWCKPGDIVVIQRMSGIRFRREIPGSGVKRGDGSIIDGTQETVIFCTFDDHQIQDVLKDGFNEIDQLL